MPVIGSDDVENARLEGPPLSARQIRHLALAGDDVFRGASARYPSVPFLTCSVVMSPAVGGGKKARRAKRSLPTGSLMRPSSSCLLRMNMAHLLCHA
jgi:hypothetical protein